MGRIGIRKTKRRGINLDGEEMYNNWEELENSIKDCNKCKLCNRQKKYCIWDWK